MNKIASQRKHARLMCIWMILLWIFFGHTTVFAYTGNGDNIVHVTETGVCYHLEGCSALRSDIEMTLEDAFIAGYQICSKCNPPAYTGNAKRGTEKKKRTSNSSNGNSELKNKVNTKTEEKTNSWPILRICIICIPVVGLGYIVTKGIIRKVKDTKERKAKIVQQRQAYEERKRYYEENYKGKSIREIVGAPEDVSISRDGIVTRGEITKEKPYGDLTVYVAWMGNRYHKNSHCRNTYGMLPINVYDAFSKRYFACTYCVEETTFPPEWYGKIPHVVAAIKEFEKEDKNANLANVCQADF